MLNIFENTPMIKSLMKLLTNVAFLLSIVISQNSISAVPEKIVIGLKEEPEMGLDPVKGWGKYGHPLIQSTLLKRDRDFNLVGDLAEKFELSVDRLSWMIKLRDDVYFSDGKKLTSEDVVFTFKELVAGPSFFNLSMLDRVEKLDTSTIRFVLTKPDLAFADTLSTVGIVPMSGYDQNYGHNPIGSGPFMLSRWDKGQQIVLKRNPYYYGKMAEFDIFVIVFAGEDSLYNLLHAGDLHLASIPARYGKSVPSQYRLSRVKTNDNRGIVWPFLAPSSKEPGNLVTADLAIRKAVDNIVDREYMVESILMGFGQEAFSLSDGLPWGPIERERQPISLQNLKVGLDKAGWLLCEGCKIRNKDGVNAEFTIFYPAGDSVREHLALSVSHMVKPLGIKINVRGGSWEQIARKMHDNPVLMGFGSHTIEEMFLVYGSDTKGVGWYNSGNYSNSVVDASFESIRASDSLEDTLPMWQSIYYELDEDLPWTWLVSLEHLYAVSQCLDIGNPYHEPHQHGWPITRNIDEWSWVCD